MSGLELAEKVILEFDTNDVFVIAEKSGVKIIYETWQPVTLGEFHQKTKTIYVNLNANVTREGIIAHELGHYFFRTQVDFQNLDIDEETFCDEFTKELLK